MSSKESLSLCHGYVLGIALFQLVLKQLHPIGLNHSSVDSFYLVFYTLTFIWMDSDEGGNVGRPPLFNEHNYAYFKS